MRGLFLLQLFVEKLCNLSEQVVAGVAAIDAMVAVGVDVHLEILVGLHQCLGIFIGILRMHIDIGMTVADELCTVQVVHTLNGVGVIARGIFIGRTHIALSVNTVVKTPVGGR